MVAGLRRDRVRLKPEVEVEVDDIVNSNTKKAGAVDIEEVLKCKYGVWKST